MKLRGLLEVEYGVYDLLNQHMDQIKLDSGPHTYRMLQTQLALGKDAWVENWLRMNGYVEDPNDAPPNDKALPFEEQIKDVIKKEIDECWKTYKQVGMKKKGNKMVPNCVPKNEEVDENLRNWFKKEKWKRIDTQGNIAGDCGTMPKGKKTQRCLPQAKAQSLTKKQRAATSRKKTASNKQFVKNTKAAKVKK
tara:strand:+ start:919 stop:1497 length:579 start_codon:yes stop_codon:yes gene_type:complete